MGAIGGMFGLGGGASGTGMDAPAQANIQTGVDPSQVQSAFGQNQYALAQQNNLLQALQSQNGLKNQSDVYGQLQGVANGTGPNPAMAMLNQQTGENVANQAALMAGQRGAGSNAGLIARQAGMQGGALQQQAVGQGATMQANQSLNAIGQAGNMANTMAANQIGQTNANTSAQQAEQANLLNAMGARNTASVGSQSSVNAGNTTLANTGMQGQQKLIGGALGAVGGMMGGMAHGGAVTHFDNGGMLSPSVLPQQVQQGPASSFGQYLATVNDGGAAQMAPSSATGDSGDNSLEKGASKMSKGMMNQSGLTGKSKSGDSSGMMAGGPSDSMGSMSSASGAGASASGVDAAAGGAAAGGGAAAAGGGGGGLMAMIASNPELLAVAASRGGKVGSGDMVDVVVSPGEKIVPPDKVAKAAGGKVEGKTVPGKAKVEGDNLKNDTVKTSLPAGTIVVPRTKSKDNKKAASFVHATLAKRGRK